MKKKEKKREIGKKKKGKKHKEKRKKIEEKKDRKKTLRKEKMKMSRSLQKPTNQTRKFYKNHEYRIKRQNPIKKVFCCLKQ